MTSKQTDKELEEITHILNQNGAIQHTIRTAREYKKRAKEAIKNFPLETRRLFNSTLVLIDANRYYKSIQKYC